MLNRDERSAGVAVEVNKNVYFEAILRLFVFLEGGYNPGMAAVR